uniref:Secreted protein n=1 Tax=Macrostomum lignano TaxID=282301 RepID=A0A1I8JPZ8_9PLAT
MAKRLWLRMFPLGFRDEFLVMFALSWPAPRNKKRMGMYLQRGLMPVLLWLGQNSVIADKTGRFISCYFKPYISSR